LDQVIEELKQKVSAKTQRFSKYRKRQNQYYQNKMFRTDCKKFYNLLREKKKPMWKMHQPKKKQRTFGKKYLEKRFNTTLDQKPVPTNSQNGNKSNISNDGHRGTKNDVKLEISWKRPNSTFLSQAT